MLSRWPNASAAPAWTPVRAGCRSIPRSALVSRYKTYYRPRAAPKPKFEDLCAQARKGSCNPDLLAKTEDVIRIAAEVGVDAAYLLALLMQEASTFYDRTIIDSRAMWAAQANPWTTTVALTVGGTFFLGGLGTLAGTEFYRRGLKKDWFGERGASIGIANVTKEVFNKQVSDNPDQLAGRSYEEMIYDDELSITVLAVRLKGNVTKYNGMAEAGGTGLTAYDLAGMSHMHGEPKVGDALTKPEERHNLPGYANYAQDVRNNLPLAMYLVCTQTGGSNC
ncbi:hypothetical protein ACQEVZ_44395 [Dactylosporangium sp. CA-152071]|uniref:hypothetical protein n=1 Tax=Dactylosporangium sp. CA-152071 TaxID=3239933 RepID=UPI003D90563B